MKKYYLYPIGFILILYLVNCAYQGGDFDVYLFEATKLRAGLNIYQAPYFEGMSYSYSVLWVLILVPFSYLPNFIPELIWLFTGCFFLYRSYVILAEWLSLEVLPQNKKFMLMIICLVSLIRFLLYNFGMIQMTFFLIYASLEGINLIQKNRKLAGAILLAFAMNIKLVPLIFLPYLIYRREFNASLYIILTFVILLFVPGIFIGFSFNIQLLKDWWIAINPSSNTRMLGEIFSGTVGLNALIPVLLMDTVGEMPFKRNFIVLPAESVKLILTICRLFLVAFTLFFLKFPPFKKFISPKQTAFEISYLFCIIPLLAPQQQKYAFFFVFPSVLYVLYFLFYQYQNKFYSFGIKKFKIAIVLFCLFLALTTFTTDGLVGRNFNLIFQHYRTITYGGIVLVALLAMCKADYLK